MYEEVVRGPCRDQGNCKPLGQAFPVSVSEPDKQTSIVPQRGHSDP